MALGPVEVIAIGFDSGELDPAILTHITALVEAGTVTIIDGIFVRKDAHGAVTAVELSPDMDNGQGAALARLAREIDGLIADEDVDVFVNELKPGGAAAILAFEHSWALPLQETIRNAGGRLLDSVHLPASVVDEVLEAVAALESEA